MQKAVTYLIANYNQEQYLADCFYSLKKQTTSHWKAFIYDDASNDNSLVIIKNFLQEFPKEKVQMIAEKKNYGKFCGIDKMVKQATTEILAILDPDDILDPKATVEILQFYEKNPHTKWAHSRYQAVNEDMSKNLKLLGEHIPSHLSFLAFGNITHLLSFQKSVYEQLESLSSSIKFAEDRDLIYKLEEKGVGGFIPKILYYYRKVEKSATQSAISRETGAKNHWIAQKNALKRRKIKGLQKYCYLILFWLIKQYYPYHYPLIVRVFFYGMHRLLRILFYPFLFNQFSRD